MIEIVFISLSCTTAIPNPKKATQVKLLAILIISVSEKLENR
jgi:hypothetical protein